jgi:outer membrane lipoprotein SlyB
MKALLCSLTILASAAGLQAQILGSSSLDGAALGGIAGALIGHNSGDLRHNGWKGAAIGAGAGLLLGAVVDANREHQAQVRTQVPVPYAPGPRVHYRQAHRHQEYGTRYVRNPGHARRGDYRVGGALLGGIAGAIIGHNSGDLRHNGWKGAAIGAGAGLLLGTIAEESARSAEAEAPYYQAEEYVERPPVVRIESPRQAAPQNVTIINNYYNAPATPMSSANGLFGR